MERFFLLIVGMLNTCSMILLLSGVTGSGTDARDSSPESCPLLGSDFRTPFSQSIRERLFINFGAPAQCNATVTSWHYCYYNRFTDDECEDAVSYMTKFLVYRQTGVSTYESVPESTKLVTLSLRCPSDGGFQCRTVSLQKSEQFTIQKNDVVAACLMERPIRVVGYEISGPSQTVYQYNANNYERCTTSQLQTISTQSSDFTLRNGIYRLHLYAETTSLVTQCSGGSNPPPFTPSVISGTYLNTDNPINCTDTIISWHYCYYPSAAANSTLTYSATVGVWRMNAAMNQYELIPGSDHILQLVQPQSTPAKIFCKTEVLRPTDYVHVQAGDVTGVSLPTQNALPLVASGANGYSLKMYAASNAPVMILQSNTLNTTSNLALHLYPTIEFIPTAPPVTSREVEPSTTSAEVSLTEGSDRPRRPGSEDTSEGDSTTDNDETPTSDGSGSNHGETVAIILVSLLLIIIAAAVVGIIGYMLIRGLRGRKKMKFTLQERSSGPVPYYEKVDDVHNAVMPQHYEQPIALINKTSQVYYSQVGPDCAHEYSVLLEQVSIDAKELHYEVDPYYMPAKEENELYAQLHRQGIKMIRIKDIEVTDILGEGQFGTVRKGIWRNASGPSTIVEVAVKTLKAGSEERDKVKFLQEATIMAQFKHGNVVTLHGVVTTTGIVMIVVELLPKGDLKQYLIAMKPDPGLMLPSLTPKTLLTFCQQIALGMLYLASKGFVHRDLAARNILLSEECICKIADFGMSRDLADDDYYVSQGGKVPLKWTAPEAIHYRKYSSASDVWSYGCLLYEIWSLGHKPFGAMRNQEVIAKVDSGYRLPPPPGCPKVIYKIMIDCWHPTTAHRPGFRSILLTLMEKEETVLNVPSDAGSEQLAAVLGAPLEAGFNMYSQLQTVYCADYALLD